MGATEVHASTAGDPDRRRRRDPVPTPRADEPRLSRDPQADRAVLLRGNRLDKEPAETWRQYGVLFPTYSTSTITPELLAALAQVESSGNPVDRTYWRWRRRLNPFAIYQSQ
jgi:hypothetical protein